jgi:hypothetical protein
LPEGDEMELHALETVIDGAERITDNGAEDHQGRDHNNGNQHKNQRVFNQALAFFFRGEKHGLFPPFLRILREAIPQVNNIIAILEGKTSGQES